MKKHLILFNLLKPFFKKIKTLLLNFIMNLSLLVLRYLIRYIRKIFRFFSRRGAAIWHIIIKIKNVFEEELYKCGELVFNSDSINIYTEQELLDAAYVVEKKAKASPVQMSWEYGYTDVKALKWIADLKGKARTTAFKTMNALRLMEASAKVRLAFINLRKTINAKANQPDFDNTSDMSGKIIEFHESTIAKVISFLTVMKQMMVSGLTNLTKSETSILPAEMPICIPLNDNQGTIKGERLYDLRE